MDTKRICPGCQKPLPPDVPMGLCPECLIKAGFNTGTESGGESTGFIPPPVADIAKLFPQLEIIEFIGKGGMGAVYKARQPALDRFVALKILPPRVASVPGFAERFNREARALARLVHPNIVAVYDFGKAGELNYLIMEFVDGANLREVERAGRLAPEQALAIVPQICEALQFAHNEGIVHRDIKPENILLDKKGRVKITDFGIAKILGVTAEKGSLTGAKDVIGTPHYMAPEQIEHPAQVDHRADIFSLGVVFYEMLTGELPLGRFQPPSARVQIDVRLDEVVLHALEKEPARRYQQASEVKTRVETIAADAGKSEAGGREAKVEHGPVPAAIPSFRVLVQFVGLGVAFLLVCLLILLGMSSDAISGKTWGYFRLGFEFLAGTASVLFLFGVYRAIRTNTRESWRGVKAGLPMMIFMVIGIVFGFWAPHLLSIKSDYIGKTLFPLGDSIEITSVNRTKNQITVKGHYNLVSADKAELQIHITSTIVTGTPTDARQRMQILKGRGDFVTTHPHVVPGMPHVNMYPVHGGHPFAELYFGTRSEALEESKMDLGHDQARNNASASQLTQEGWQLWQAQKLGEAAAKFQQAVQLAPLDTNAWNGLGWAEFNSGKSDEAEKAFQRTVSLDPNHPGALNGLGQIYLSRRNYDEAEKFLLKAASQAPAAWFGLARLYLLEGKFDQAEKWAQQIVDSGQADEVARQMLNAARKKSLNDGLRLMIEPRASNAPPASASQSIEVDPAAEEAKTRAIAKVNYIRRWLLAFHQFAQANQGQFPTNFDLAFPYLSDDAKAEFNLGAGQSLPNTSKYGLTQDRFEIINHGPLNALTSPSSTIVIREKEAWQRGDGHWVRAYAFADGHCEIYAPTDGSYEKWENEHTQKPSGPVELKLKWAPVGERVVLGMRGRKKKR